MDTISRLFDNLYKGKIVLTKINFYIFRRESKYLWGILSNDNKEKMVSKYQCP